MNKASIRFRAYFAGSAPGKNSKLLVDGSAMELLDTSSNGCFGGIWLGWHDGLDGALGCDGARFCMKKKKFDTEFYTIIRQICIGSSRA